ncbi:MAG: hypothetical protein KC619_31900 [Myxococcales bacterium]|nr:hypothetical protein [Myxococcales bacterium]
MLVPPEALARAVRDHGGEGRIRDATPALPRRDDTPPEVKAQIAEMSRELVACPPQSEGTAGARVTEHGCNGRYVRANDIVRYKGRPLGRSKAPTGPKICKGCITGRLRYEMRQIEALSDLDDDLEIVDDAGAAEIDASIAERDTKPESAALDEDLDDDEHEEEHEAFIEHLRSDPREAERVIGVVLWAVAAHPAAPLATTQARAALLRRLLGWNLPAIAADLGGEELSVEVVSNWITRGRARIVEVLEARTQVGLVGDRSDELDAIRELVLEAVRDGRADEGRPRPWAQGPRPRPTPGDPSLFDGMHAAVATDVPQHPAGARRSSET